MVPWLVPWFAGAQTPNYNFHTQSQRVKGRGGRWGRASERGTRSGDLFVMESVVLFAFLLAANALNNSIVEQQCRSVFGKEKEEGEGGSAYACSLIKREKTRGETAKQTTTSDCICT